MASADHIENYKTQLVEFLKGGFAPNVILLREFEFEKAGIILDGLHFSAWILLGHLHARHRILLEFMKDPDKNQDIWPEAYWPENHQPETRQEWDSAIDRYEEDLQEMIALVSHPGTDIFKSDENGDSISRAALTVLHHTGYHIGQLKTIGRQLGVW